MTTRDDLELALQGWLEQAAIPRPVELDEVFRRTHGTWQRPAWASLERWLPMQIALLRRPTPMFMPVVVIIGLLLVVLLGALLLGAGARTRPSSIPGHSAIGFAGDGRQLVTESGLYDSETGAFIRALDAPGSPFAVSPDGRLYATVDGGPPTTTYVSELESGQRLGSFAGTCCYGAISPDGRYLAAPSDGPHLTLFDIESGAVVKRAETTGPVVFSPDGSQMLVGLPDETAGDLAAIVPVAGSTMDPSRLLRGRFGHGGQVAWSPDDRLVATTTTSGPVAVWEVDGSDDAIPLSPPKGAATSVAFSPDSQLIAVGTNAGTALLWTLSPTGPTLSRTIVTGGDEVLVSFSPDGDRLAATYGNADSGSWDTAIWDIDAP